MIKLTYMIPTIGRTTLAAAVDSILGQMTDEDELFVIGDGEQGHARQVMRDPFRQRLNVFYLEFGPTNHYGSEQLDYATQLARGDFLCYLGDDDRLLPGAIETIRSAVAGAEIYPHIFSMHTIDKDGIGVVRGGSIEPSRVSGQQIVVPNDKRRLPKYRNAIDGGPNDYVFIRDCIAAFAGYRMHAAGIVDGSRVGHGLWF